MPKFGRKEKEEKNSADIQIDNFVKSIISTPAYPQPSPPQLAAEVGRGAEAGAGGPASCGAGRERPHLLAVRITVCNM